MSNKPPRIVIPGLNRGAGIPAGYVLGRRQGTGQGPAQLLDLTQLQAFGVAPMAYTAQEDSRTASTAASATDSLSASVSTQISSVVSTNVTQSTSLSQISSSLSGAISTNVGQSTSLSQISSSLSGAISSTTSLSTAVSTVISGSISTVNSRIDSLSTAVGGGGTIDVEDEGTPVLTATTLNFTGAGVVATDAGGGVADITITGGGGPDPGQSTSLSQISSSLSGAISSTSSLSTAVSTVISGSISTTLSTAASATASLSTALGFSGASVRKAADQTSVDYSTTQPVLWDTEILDVSGWHNFTATVTITIASPGVVTWTAHGLHNNAPVVFTTTGALPTGLTAGIRYFIINAATDTFQVSATLGGGAINTSGSQSGVHTGTNTSILRVPSGVSYIQTGAAIALNNLLTTAAVSLNIAKNGSQTFDGVGRMSFVPAVVAPRLVVISAPLAVSAGDNFEAYLGSGADTSMDVTATLSHFWARAVG